jgi:hypothetical protein
LAGRPIAYKGKAFTIAYAVDKNGRSPGKEFFDALPLGDQAKVMSLFGRLGDYGSIRNPEKFRKLEGNCYEFKSFQIRMPWILEEARPGPAGGDRASQENL